MNGLNKVIKRISDLKIRVFTPRKYCERYGHVYEDCERYFLVNSWKCKELTGWSPYRAVGAEISETGQQCRRCGDKVWSGEYEYESGYHSITMTTDDTRRFNRGELLWR